MHGQALADELKKRKGEKPSPGTIYPALKVLKESRLIKETKSGKTIIYSLTPHGRKILDVAKKRFCRIFMGVIAT